MKNKSTSLDFRDARPKAKLECSLEPHGFLDSVFVKDAARNLGPEPLRYCRAPTERAATLPELVTGHA